MTSHPYECMGWWSHTLLSVESVTELTLQVLLPAIQIEQYLAVRSSDLFLLFIKVVLLLVYLAAVISSYLVTILLDF